MYDYDELQASASNAGMAVNVFDICAKLISHINPHLVENLIKSQRLHQPSLKGPTSVLWSCDDP